MEEYTTDLTNNMRYIPFGIKKTNPLSFGRTIYQIINVTKTLETYPLLEYHRNVWTTTTT